ncbi:hypothetical protein MTF65_13775 [Streptomyces sp. APSN-46.1]|uniref:hypothetical protein n=1 Tax=Streptomyces sp. APSN-46.1 TaxID=2929049 RepID=UPI001FB20D9A|nr:hypothetical protein [Streptomyces sp. APSN-46.1]MCJ1678400.1 hypothetical protein [Streptomyces sp. APSN-46.1]
MTPDSSTPLGGWWWKNSVQVTAYSYNNCGGGRISTRTAWIDTTSNWDFQVVGVH